MRRRHAAASAALLLGLGPTWALAIDGTTVMHGACKRLDIDGRKVPSPCAGELRFTHGKDGRNGIVFRTDDGRLYRFSGRDADELSPDEDTIDMPVSRAELPGNASAAGQKAVGVCRYGNPHLGSADVQCRVHTLSGTVDARFVTDGREPVER